MGRMNRSLRRLTLALILSVGCGSSSPGERLSGASLGVEVAAPAVSAVSYDTQGSPEAASGESSSGVEAGVLEAAEAEHTSLEGDGRLAQLALWTLERLGEGGALPPPEIITFFSHHLGLVEPVPHLALLGQTDPARFQAGIRDSVAQFLNRQTYTHYGVAVVKRGGLWLAMVALSTRRLRMAPVARRVEVGQPIVLRGELASGYRAPELVFRAPDGEVVRREAVSGSRFDFSIATESEGAYELELLAVGPRGASVVANFPVYAGVDVPESLNLGANGAADSGDPARVPDDLLVLLNRARRDRGLGVVAPHTGLADVAESHSRDMATNDFVAHLSPSTGTPVQRVEAAGYRSGLVLENIGRGYSASEIHAGLMSSPGHRANILNPNVTHVGVGVVSLREGRRDAHIATEIFIRMVREIDTDSAPARLLSMLNEARRARGAPPLETDENLRRASQGAVDDYFADHSISQQDAMEQASFAMRPFAIAFERVGGVMALVSSVDEASRLEPALDPEVGYVGIGVAQGDRPDQPPNSIAVIILLGWSR